MNILYLVLACGTQQSPQVSKASGDKPLVERKSNNDGSGTEQVVDVDGNIYGVLTIKGKRWLAQNLKVKRYRNGDPIEYKESPIEWKNTSRGLAIPFGNKEETIEYGLLYNFYAIGDTRGLCPTGFRVPHNQEFASVFGPASIFQDKGLGFRRIYDASDSDTEVLRGMSPSDLKKLEKMFDLGDRSFQRERENKGMYWSQDTRDEEMKLAWIVTDADLGEYAWGAYVDGYSVRCIED